MQRPAAAPDCDFVSREASKATYAGGTTFQIGTIELCSNTGTYLDSPWHRYIVECMTNPVDVPDAGYRCHAGPVKVRGMGTFPVRAFAEVD